MARFLLLTILLIESVLCMAQDTPPKMNLKVGEMYALNYTLKSATETSAGNESVFITIKIRAGLIFTVKDIGKDIYRLQAHYNYIGMQSKTPQLEFSMNTDMIDTSKIENKAAYNAFLNLTNKPFTVYVNPHGELIRVEGLEEIVASILNMTDDDAKKSLPQPMNLFGSTLFYLSFGVLNSIYPNTTIDNNQVWESHLPLTNKTKAYFINTNRYKESSDNDIEITGTGVLMDFEDMANTFQGANNVTIKGSSTSNATLHGNNFWPKTVNVSQHINIDIIKTEGVSLNNVMDLNYSYTGNKIEY